MATPTTTVAPVPQYAMSDVSARMLEILGNPASMQRLSLNLTQQITSGEALVMDATSSYANAIESTAIMASTAVTAMTTLTRQAYPSLATTDEDNYRHMADEDYLGIFATPARGTFMFVFNRTSILSNAVTDPDNPQIQKIVIPRYATVSNGLNNFTLQYPIIIRVYPNKAISIMWDVSQLSPIQKIDQSYIPNWIKVVNNVEFICFQVTLDQLSLTSVQGAISNVGGHAKTYGFVDQFYYARAFIQNSNKSGWTEISTTHTDSIYDPNIPTMLLRVVGNALSTSVPLVYINNGRVNNALRVDIYSTAGGLDYLMTGFSNQAFQVKWNTSLADAATAAFSAPLNTLGLNAVQILGVGAVVGGSNGLSTPQVRDRFITRASSGDGVAITPAQIRNKFSAAGYDLTLSIDRIGDRVFLATREIPANLSGTQSSANTTVSGMGMTIGLLQSTINGLVNNQGIKDHGTAITILPTALFQRRNTVLSLVSDAQLTMLNDRNQTTVEEMAAMVNASEYLFTPFHNRISLTGFDLAVKAYYLTNPALKSKQAVFVNDAALIGASTNQYAVGYNKTNDGYTLALEVVGDANFYSLGPNRVNVQLSYVGNSGGARQYINGVLVSQLDSTGMPLNNQWVYHFPIATDFDIDINDNLILSNGATVALTSQFDLSIVVSNHLPAGASGNVGRSYYDPTQFVNYDSTAVYLQTTQESITLYFGDPLNDLWSRFRSIAGMTQYQTYAADVPLLYSNTVVERNLSNLPVMHRNETTGLYEAVIIHNIGDPVLDAITGVPILKAAAGSLVYDANGLPVVVGGDRGVMRQIELMLFDGKYFFANDATSTQYKLDATATLRSWIIEDIPAIGADVMELTKVLYYPKVTMDHADATVDDGTQVKLDTAQNVSVDYYLTADNYNNSDLKDSITTNTPAVLLAALRASDTISIQDVQSALKTAMGDDIIAVKVTGLFDNLYDVVTINDASMTLGIGKLLSVKTDMTLQVTDAIAVDFHNHTAAATNPVF